MDDHTIIRLYWNRDEEAIKQTDAVYGRKLHSLADHIVRNREDAEESVSDTYWKAWETIPPTRPQYLFAYLAQICRRISLNVLEKRDAAKRNAEIISLTEEMELCIPDSRRNNDWKAKEIRELLNQFLASLSPQNRMIFMRRYWYADSIEEIAVRSGLNQGAVLTRLHRIRTKLCTYLEREERYV